MQDVIKSKQQAAVRRRKEVLMESDILTHIQLSYNQLTRTEKKIADYVLGHTDQVLLMSISDLADACGAADASVHRFCRRMGAGGYQEFKMKLSLSLPADDRRGREEDPRYMGLEQSLDGLLAASISALKETRKLADFQAIEKTVDMMEAARRIYFFGVGDSLLSAQAARNKFLRITGKAECLQDPHMQAMAASMVTGEDLIVFFSYSGSTKDNIHVARIARASGAKIVAITRYLKSPLTAFTDEILLCGSDEGPFEGGSMGVKMSQLYLIDLLFFEYYRRNYERSRDNNQKTSEAVVKKLF